MDKLNCLCCKCTINKNKNLYKNKNKSIKDYKIYYCKDCEPYQSGDDIKCLHCLKTT